MSGMGAAFFLCSRDGREDSSDGSFCPIRTEPLENRVFSHTAGKHNMLHVYPLMVAICCGKFGCIDGVLIHHPAN